MLLSSADSLFTLGDVPQANDFRLVIRSLLLSLLFSFFSQLSFERASYLESSFLPKRINGPVNVAFSFVSHSFTTLSASFAERTATETQHITWTQAIEASRTWQNTKWRTKLEVQIKTPIYARSTYNFFSSSPAPLVAITLIFDLNFGSISFYGTGQQKRRKTALGGVSGRHFVSSHKKNRFEQPSWKFIL